MSGQAQSLSIPLECSIRPYRKSSGSLGHTVKVRGGTYRIIAEQRHILEMPGEAKRVQYSRTGHFSSSGSSCVQQHNLEARVLLRHAREKHHLAPRGVSDSSAGVAFKIEETEQHALTLVLRQRDPATARSRTKFGEN